MTVDNAVTVADSVEVTATFASAFEVTVVSAVNVAVLVPDSVANYSYRCRRHFRYRLHYR